MTKSRRNELEDLRYGLSNHETLKLHLLCISLTLKARKISEKLEFLCCCGADLLGRAFFCLLNKYSSLELVTIESLKKHCLST
jgi:hypothetical protein